MDIPQYIERAQMALKEGEIELAQQYFQQILKKYPNNPEALTGMKDIKIALSMKRIPFWMREIKLLWLYTSILLGRSEKIYPEMEFLYDCQPDNLRTAMAFALCAEKSNQLEKSHEAYQSVLQSNATNAKALAGDAEVLVKLDRLEEAATLYKRLQALKPDDDKITHRLRDISAQSYARTGIPEKLQERRAMIEKEKLEAEAPPEIMEQMEDALESFKQNPDNKDAGVKIAATYRKADLYDQANKTLAIILDKDPDFAPARREQARVWRQSGDMLIAQNLYEELLEASPDDKTLIDEYLQTCVTLLKQQHKENPDDNQILSQLESIKIKRDKNRIELLEDIITEHPEVFEERLELGDLLIRNGTPNEAIPLLQRVIHEPGFAGKGLFLLGQCFHAKGDTALAVQQFEKSLVFFKNKSYSHVLTDELKSIYYSLGSAKEELGDKTGASEAFGEVYSADINYKDIRQRYENLFN
jgi:tetratricopeptide (TPR) repeat protein